MFTIIGGDGKEYGPTSTEQLQAWIKAGRASLDTKARALGSDEWRRLGDYAEFSLPGGEPPPMTPTGAVAAAAPVGPVDVKAFAADLITRAAPLDVFSCLDRSFSLWKAHLLPLVGITLLVVLLQSVTSMIPFVGLLSGLFLNGVFYGGLYYYYLGRMRGQHREVADAFAGFTRAFVPLMLATLLTTALTIAIMLPFFASWIPYFVQLATHGDAAAPPMPEGWMWLSLVFGTGVVLYFSMAWAFTFALVIDKKLGPWTAMEVSRRVITRQWFRFFAVAILGTILMMLGLIALFIGVLFTLPLLFGAILYAYEDLCNPPPKN